MVALPVEEAGRRRGEIEEKCWRTEEQSEDRRKRKKYSTLRAREEIDGERDIEREG